MKTISAKQLRQQLDSVLDSAISGEDVVVKHRFKDPVRISAVKAKPSSSKLQGLAVFDACKKTPLYDETPCKQQYTDHLDQKYGSS